MKIQLSDFQNKPHITITEEEVNGAKLYIATSDIYWGADIYREARGITFDENGDVVVRPFAKFYDGIEETPFTDLIIEGAKYYKNVHGHTVTPIVIDGKVFFKTKESFYSTEAQECQLAFAADENIVKFCNYMKLLNMTPIFKYDFLDGLTLLDIRRFDGLHILRVTSEYLAKCHNLDIVKKIEGTLDKSPYFMVLRNRKRVKMG
ncbi:hypothetical protein UFOVP84_64 [uncultured Caudovirales phage]|uniref:Uncharacterized protein n=1 Tax=uncultured Caudovirales phage TaxID=2100421 RepID=A0A6J5KYP1_9CAUD|nr:hypothetical protein UFOVP84_64 [uncultured Caudovirales phage]